MHTCSLAYCTCALLVVLVPSFLLGFSGKPLFGRDQQPSLRRLSDGRGEALEGSGDGFDRVARRVHIDQDMEGDPLRERGLVWLFKLPGTPREPSDCWLLLDSRVHSALLATRGSIATTALLNC